MHVVEDFTSSPCSPAANTDHYAVAAPVRLALPSAATDQISPPAIYQHQRRQAAELRELSVRRLTATTVSPVTECETAIGHRHWRRSAGGKTVPDLGGENFPYWHQAAARKRAAPGRSSALPLVLSLGTRGAAITHSVAPS
jgi:hypothetical protein